MKAVPVATIVLGLSLLSLSGCVTHAEEHAKHEAHKVTVTTPTLQDVVITEEYVCQIRSRRHIELHAIDDGYIDQIPVKEGQAVKQGDLLFSILPTLYRAELEAKLAEVRTAKVELEQSKKLAQERVVSQVDVNLHEAKVAKAQAEANLAEARLKFTEIRAPFDGIVDKINEQLGSLVGAGDMLTTLSDNNVMWVYFNVREARYLEYMARLRERGVEEQTATVAQVDGTAADAATPATGEPAAETGEESEESDIIGLVLADGSKFPYPGVIGAIEANFNNETGNIPFRADFPNPDGLLRHGQTGKVRIERTLKHAVVIPQRAVFEVLARRYVFVVDEQGKVHQRDIVVAHEKEDIFVLKEGLEVGEKIVLEGVRQVRDGDTVEFELLSPEEVLGSLKYKAE